MTRSRIRAAIPAGAVALAVALAAGPSGAQDMASGTTAVLRGLDKVSGTTTDLTLAVGAQVDYGRLRIELVACRFPADDPNAEAFAFLDILDAQRGERLFYGWMVATAPALNALDHPRFDVWVLGCR